MSFFSPAGSSAPPSSFSDVYKAAENALALNVKPAKMHRTAVSATKMQQILSHRAKGAKMSRVVVIGRQGQGKTTLINRWTGENRETGASQESLTKENFYGKFEEFEIVDTPGIAGDQIKYSHARDIRKALTERAVDAIFVVQGLPEEGRIDSMVQSLKPVDDILRCDTFKEDDDGVMHFSKLDPYFTTVTLLVTKTDLVKGKQDAGTRRQMDSVEALTEAAATLWSKYPWIGDVRFVNHNTEQSFLRDYILRDTHWRMRRRYRIKDQEFVTKFPIQLVISVQCQGAVDRRGMEFKQIANQALQHVQAIVMQRPELHGSSDVDPVSPVVDAVLEFIDDLWLSKTNEALRDVTRMSDEQLWSVTDTAALIDNMKHLDAVKRRLDPYYAEVKAAIVSVFPRDGQQAIYKACPFCGEVYVKPVGCDFSTTCGNRTGKVQDVRPMRYKYERGQFTVVSDVNYVDQLANRMRCLRTTMSRALSSPSHHHYRASPNVPRPSELRLALVLGSFHAELVESSPATPRSPKAAGCGRDISWVTMKPLSQEELAERGLLPQDPSFTGLRIYEDEHE